MRGLKRALPIALIVLAVIAAYANSLHGPFVYDDVDAIANNPSIRHGATALHPPSDTTVGGRPLLNLSFALSYALSGSHVWGFHAVNLLIHLGAALALFGLLRRTLASEALAFGVALVWAVHPLQTESVTYLVQRAESLMGLFLILTLYCFVRGVQPSFAPHGGGASAGEKAGGERQRLWLGLSVLACLFGAATKEVMYAAPLLVLLYDATFRSGSLAAALKARRGYYAALAASWLLLGLLIATTGGNRGGSIGFGIGVSPWAYALTQFHAVASYLRLSVLPWPLVFDRGPQWVHGAADVLPYVPIVVAALAATVWALRRRPAWGFWGAWFFLILAPTSSIVPGTTQMIVEHRMYLPLAAVLVVIGLALERGVGRLAAAVLVGSAVPCAVLTAARNRDYRSELALWGATVRSAPSNGYARTNYGVALYKAGRYNEAEAQYRRAIQLAPGFVEPLTDFGNAEAKLGHYPEALAWFGQALQLKPSYAENRIDLGGLLIDLGRYDEAIEQLSQALSAKPNDAEAQSNWGLALTRSGHPDAALPHFAAALALAPDQAEIWFNQANAERMLGRRGDAVRDYQQALALDPHYAAAAGNLGTLFLQAGQLPNAVHWLEASLQADPGSPDAHNSLGLALARSGDLTRATAEFEAALRLRPNYPAAEANLQTARRAAAISR